MFSLEYNGEHTKPMQKESLKDNIKIILGGGTRAQEGWVNLDILDLPEVDIICNLNKGIPLPDNSVIEVKARHILEHLDDTVKIMEEIWRVCKPNARVFIKSPYYTSIGAFKDPTHKRFFTERTFEYFLPKSHWRTVPDYHFRCTFEINSIGYIWSSRWIRFLPFKSFLRKHFWNIARTIIITLRVVK